jgi:NTP pyrophosphatase (non-canonical NTP hydrolase)
MKDNEVVGDFQEMVSEVLIRHRSILDCLSKYQESTARVNRSVIKTVTDCGCISINANKKQYPPMDSLKECGKYMDSHIKGKMCEHCREVIAEELGKHLFYLTALCNILDYKLEDLFDLEYNRITTLGHFLLS